MSHMHLPHPAPLYPPSIEGIEGGGGGRAGGGGGGGREAVVERFRRLEEQLVAIESTARAVEGEFKDSNQVWD